MALGPGVTVGPPAYGLGITALDCVHEPRFAAELRSAFVMTITRDQMGGRPMFFDLRHAPTAGVAGVFNNMVKVLWDEEDDAKGVGTAGAGANGHRRRQKLPLSDGAIPSAELFVEPLVKDLKERPKHVVGYRMWLVPPPQCFEPLRQKLSVWLEGVFAKNAPIADKDALAAMVFDNLIQAKAQVGPVLGDLSRSPSQMVTSNTVWREFVISHMGDWRYAAALDNGDLDGTPLWKEGGHPLSPAVVFSALNAFRPVHGVCAAQSDQARYMVDGRLVFPAPVIRLPRNFRGDVQVWQYSLPWEASDAETGEQLPWGADFEADESVREEHTRLAKACVADYLKWYEGRGSVSQSSEVQTSEKYRKFRMRSHQRIEQAVATRLGRGTAPPVKVKFISPLDIPQAEEYITKRYSKLDEDASVDPAEIVPRLKLRRQFRKEHGKLLWTLGCNPSVVSPPMRVIMEHLQKAELAREAMLPVTRIQDENLSLFGNMIMRQLCKFEDVLLCHNAHFTLLLVQLASHASWWYEWSLHPNILMVGPEDASKSWVIETQQKLMLPGTWRKQLMMTSKADTAGKDECGSTEFWSEMSPEFMGINTRAIAAAGGRAGAGALADLSERGAQTKERLTSMQVSVNYCWHVNNNGRDQRVSVSVTYYCIGSMIMATNSGVEHLSSPMRSRLIVVSVENPERADKKPRSSLEPDPAELKMFVEEMHNMQALGAYTFHLLRGGELGINTNVLEVYYPRFEASLRRHGVPVKGNNRVRQNVFTLARVLTVMYANHVMWQSAEAGMLAGRKFDPMAMPQLYPLLIVTKEIAVFAMSLVGFHVYARQDVYNVVRAIRAEYFATEERIGGAYVYEDFTKYDVDLLRLPHHIREYEMVTAIKNRAQTDFGLDLAPTQIWTVLHDLKKQFMPEDSGRHTEARPDIYFPELKGLRVPVRDLEGDGRLPSRRAGLVRGERARRSSVIKPRPADPDMAHQTLREALWNGASGRDAVAADAAHLEAERAQSEEAKRKVHAYTPPCPATGCGATFATDLILKNSDPREMMRKVMLDTVTCPEQEAGVRFLLGYSITADIPNVPDFIVTQPCAETEPHLQGPTPQAMARQMKEARARQRAAEAEVEQKVARRVSRTGPSEADPAALEELRADIENMAIDVDVEDDRADMFDGDSGVDYGRLDYEGIDVDDFTFQHHVLPKGHVPWDFICLHDDDCEARATVDPVTKQPTNGTRSLETPFSESFLDGICEASFLDGICEADRPRARLIIDLYSERLNYRVKLNALPPETLKRFPGSYLPVRLLNRPEVNNEDVIVRRTLRPVKASRILAEITKMVRFEEEVASVVREARRLQRRRMQTGPPTTRETSEGAGGGGGGAEPAVTSPRKRVRFATADKEETSEVTTSARRTKTGDTVMEERLQMTQSMFIAGSY